MSCAFEEIQRALSPPPRGDLRGRRRDRHRPARARRTPGARRGARSRPGGLDPADRHPQARRGVRPAGHHHQQGHGGRGRSDLPDPADPRPGLSGAHGRVHLLDRRGPCQAGAVRAGQGRRAGRHRHHARAVQGAAQGADGGRRVRHEPHRRNTEGGLRRQLPAAGPDRGQHGRPGGAGRPRRRDARQPGDRHRDAARRRARLGPRAGERRPAGPDGADPEGHRRRRRARGLRAVRDRRPDRPVGTGPHHVRVRARRPHP